MTHDKGFNRAVWFTLLLALSVIALGAYTRLTEAGLGCPDWPGCYGQLLVPMGESQLQQAQQAYPDAPFEAEKAWNEMVHRYIAGGLGLMILFLNVMAWRKPERPKGLPFIILMLVVFQAVLGMWTVTLSLMPLVVMGHLLGGFTIASLLLLLALRLSKRRHFPQPRQKSQPLVLVAIVALIAVIAQIALGGWTAANYAATVCTQLPICEVDWLGNFKPEAFQLIQPVHDSYQYGVLDFAERVSIHATHRIGAMVASGVVLVLIVMLCWYRWFGLAMLNLGLLLVQVLLGITNVVASLPLMVAVGHNLGGVLLLMALVATNYRLYSCIDQRVGYHLHMSEEL